MASNFSDIASAEFLNKVRNLGHFASIRKYGNSIFTGLLETYEYDHLLDKLTFCIVGGDVKFLYGNYTDDELFQMSSKGDYYFINRKFLPPQIKGDPIVRRILFNNEGKILLEDAMVASFNTNKCWLNFCNLLTNSLFLQIVNIDDKTYLQLLEEAIVDVGSAQIKEYIKNSSSEEVSRDCLISFIRNFSSAADAGALQQGFWTILDKQFFHTFRQYFTARYGCKISLASKEVSDNLLGHTIHALREHPGDKVFDVDTSAPGFVFIFFKQIHKYFDIAKNCIIKIFNSLQLS